MLPSDFVLGVDEHSEDGFAIVGIHLKVSVGESASNASQQSESQIELGVMDDKSFAQCAEELCALALRSRQSFEKACPAFLQIVMLSLISS